MNEWKIVKEEARKSSESLGHGPILEAEADLEG